MDDGCPDSPSMPIRAGVCLYGQACRYGQVYVYTGECVIPADAGIHIDTGGRAALCRPVFLSADRPVIGKSIARAGLQAIGIQKSAASGCRLRM